MSFNPRTPAGCDLPEGYTPQRLYDVSTHAPLRGATCEGVLFCWNHGSFNPRTPAGCDGISMALTLFSKVSTHAPLRGATLTIVQPLTPKQFQPTHPCGVRPGACGLGSVIADVSTHAPLRGATKYHVGSDDYICVSTHAPLRGATLSWFLSCTPVVVSTHAPLRGATFFGHPE